MLYLGICSNRSSTYAPMCHVVNVFSNTNTLTHANIVYIGYEHLTDIAKKLFLGFCGVNVFRVFKDVILEIRLKISTLFISIVLCGLNTTYVVFPSICYPYNDTGNEKYWDKL